MSLIDRAIAVNHKRAARHDPSLAQKPAPKIAILTCMDPRLNELLHWLDIKPADADVMRGPFRDITECVTPRRRKDEREHALDNQHQRDREQEGASYVHAKKCAAHCAAPVSRFV